VTVAEPCTIRGPLIAEIASGRYPVRRFLDKRLAVRLRDVQRHYREADQLVGLRAAASPDLNAAGQAAIRLVSPPGRAGLLGARGGVDTGIEAGKKPGPADSWPRLVAELRHAPQIMSSLPSKFSLPLILQWSRHVLGALARLGGRSSISKQIIADTQARQLIRGSEKARFQVHGEAPQAGRAAISQRDPAIGKSSTQPLGVPGLDLRVLGQVGASRLVRCRCRGPAQPRRWTRRWAHAQSPSLVVALSRGTRTASIEMKEA
jgi:hypothetical protein